MTQENEEFILSTNNLIGNVFSIDKNKSKDEVIEVLKKTVLRLSKLSTEERNEFIIWLRGTLKSFLKNDREVEEVIKQVKEGRMETMKSGIAMAFEDYAEEKVKEVAEKEIKATTEKATKEAITNTAIKLLKKGIDIEVISEVTELSIEEVKKIQIKEKK